MVQIRMFLEGGEKEGVAGGPCQPEQGFPRWKIPANWVR